MQFLSAASIFCILLMINCSLLAIKWLLNRMNAVDYFLFITMKLPSVRLLCVYQSPALPHRATSAYVIIICGQSLKGDFVGNLVRGILLGKQDWWSLGPHTSDRKHFCHSAFTSLIHKVHIRDPAGKRIWQYSKLSSVYPAQSFPRCSGGVCGWAWQKSLPHKDIQHFQSWCLCTSLSKWQSFLFSLKPNWLLDWQSGHFGRSYSRGKRHMRKNTNEDKAITTQALMLDILSSKLLRLRHWMVRLSQWGQLISLRLICEIRMGCYFFPLFSTNQIICVKQLAYSLA